MNVVGYESAIKGREGVAIDFRGTLLLSVVLTCYFLYR